MKGAEWPGVPAWDIFYVTGKNLEKNLKEICICAWPQLPQRASECWHFAIKCSLMKGMQVEVNRNELGHFSSLISCLCLTSVMSFHLLHSDSRYYMEDDLAWHPYFSLKTWKIKSPLKNIRANLGVVLNTKRLWAISGYCLLERTIKCVTGEKHAN